MHKKDNFILGYRISPEEIHGGNIGYTLDDSLYLIDKLADLGIDYIPELFIDFQKTS